MIELPDNLEIIHAYYFNDYKWRLTCLKCHISQCVLAHVISVVKRHYQWLKHTIKQETLEGAPEKCHYRNFTLKEIIHLITWITFRISRENKMIIEGYYHQDGDWKKTCDKCHISRNKLYRCLNSKVKKPYLSLFAHHN